MIAAESKLICPLVLEPAAEDRGTPVWHRYPRSGGPYTLVSLVGMKRPSQLAQVKMLLRKPHTTLLSLRRRPM